MRLWRVSDGTLLRTPGEGAWAKSVAFSPDGAMLAAAVGGVTLWEKETGRELRTLRGSCDPSWVDSVAFSPDGTMLAAGCRHGMIELWTLGR